MLPFAGWFYCSRTSLKMVEVNSSQIFMVLVMSQLIRRDCISVLCEHRGGGTQYQRFTIQRVFLLEYRDFREGILFERKAFCMGLVTYV